MTLPPGRPSRTTANMPATLKPPDSTQDRIASPRSDTRSERKESAGQYPMHARARFSKASTRERERQGKREREIEKEREREKETARDQRESRRKREREKELLKTFKRESERKRKNEREYL